jgi:hypothetical protein
MRKSLGVLLASASLLLPIAIGASPAGAAGGTKCATTSGVATFSPPLPPLGSKATVTGSFTAIGTVGKCVGGGVTTGHTKFVSVKTTTGSNCTTLITGKDTNGKVSASITGTLTTTWNTGATSTAKVTLAAVKGKSTERNVTGPITAGLFKGMKTSGVVTYAVPAGFCKTALKSLKYSQVGATVIK